MVEILQSSRSFFSTETFHFLFSVSFSCSLFCFSVSCVHYYMLYISNFIFWINQTDDTLIFNGKKVYLNKMPLRLFIITTMGKHDNAASQQWYKERKRRTQKYKKRTTASLLLSLPERQFTELYPTPLPPALLLRKWWETTRCLTELPNELMLKPVE